MRAASEGPEGGIHAQPLTRPLVFDPMCIYSSAGRHRAYIGHTEGGRPRWCRRDRLPLWSRTHSSTAFESTRRAHPCLPRHSHAGEPARAVSRQDSIWHLAELLVSATCQPLLHVQSERHNAAPSSHPGWPDQVLRPTPAAFRPCRHACRQRPYGEE